MYTIPEHLQKFEWYPGHLRWLGYDVDTGAKRADLYGADLYGANLHEANLHGANLHGANLHEANLRRANLNGANLHEANLRRANLNGANLHEANLHGANLHGADLRRANLHEADLYGANLHEADLYGANLHGADLRWANLHEADLYGANLHGARYNVLAVLQANWRGDISDGLCAAMMAFDRDAHPHPEQFKLWAQDGKCPLESANIDRALLFDERRELYNHSLAAPRPWALWTMIAKEFGVQI